MSRRLILSSMALFAKLRIKAARYITTDMVPFCSVMARRINLLLGLPTSNLKWNDSSIMSMKRYSINEDIQRRGQMLKSKAAILMGSLF